MHKIRQLKNKFWIFTVEKPFSCSKCGMAYTCIARWRSNMTVMARIEVMLISLPLSRKEMATGGAKNPPAWNQLGSLSFFFALNKSTDKFVCVSFELLAWSTKAVLSVLPMCLWEVFSLWGPYMKSLCIRSQVSQGCPPEFSSVLMEVVGPLRRECSRQGRMCVKHARAIPTKAAPSKSGLWCPGLESDLFPKYGSQVTYYILFCWLFQIQDHCKKFLFLQT